MATKLPKMRGKKNCGNGIAKMEEKKNVAIDLCHCQNEGEKNVTIDL